MKNNVNLITECGYCAKKVSFWQALKQFGLCKSCYHSYEEWFRCTYCQGSGIDRLTKNKCPLCND